MTILQQIAEGQNNAHVVFNEDIDTLSASGIFGKKHATTSGLVWGFYGGLYNGSTIADGTVTQTDAADNYVVVLRSSGVVSVSTSSANSLNALYAKLYKNTVAGGIVTASVDQRWDANGLLFNTSGTSGTVTSVSVTTANGVSGTVATATTTPAISLTLGAITPTTIVASSTIAGSNLSGTNTGDQTLSGFTVAQGGTGVATLTAYAPVFGGTTGTGAVQSGTAGTSGQVLTSNGAGVLPTFQASAGGGGDKLYMDVVSAIPPAGASGFATPTVLANGHPVLTFDGGSTNEAIRWRRRLPANFVGSTIDIETRWVMESATTGQLRAGCRVMRDNADVSVDSFATAIEAHATVSADIDDPYTITLASVSVDGAAAGEVIVIEIYRDASDTTNDTATGYGYLLDAYQS